MKPKLLQVDNGMEFYNKNFEAMLEKYNIKMFLNNSGKKAQIIERFNRTLKLRMGQLFNSQNSFKYVDKIQDLVKNYNNTIDTTIKMKPIDAIKPENYDLLINNYYENYENKINNTKFEVDDVFKISIYLLSMIKEIMVIWTRELFTISNTIDTKLTTYNIFDLNNEPKEGTFYAEELQKIDKTVLGEPFKIDKNIKKSKGKSLVKYIGHPDSFNQWTDDKI